jgi:hypothetical protein
VEIVIPEHSRKTRWLERQFDAAKEEIKTWPKWMLRESGVDHLLKREII